MENNQQGKPTLIPFRMLIMVFLVALIASSVIYTNWANLNQKLKELNLIPEPEHFTELYFENASTLPKQINPDKPLTFSFTVHNLEGATTTYPYRIYFENSAEEQTTLATDNIVSLGPNDYSTITVSYTFPLATDDRKVIVKLINLDQSIDFLLAKPQ